jgi:hypothetical protein
MPYKVFLTGSIECLENEELLGEADTYKEVCQVINTELENRALYQESYWRYLMDSTATFIDFGSWNKFIAIVPPVSNKEMMGEN